METTTAAPPPLPDSPTSPSTSVASSSTTSWPATEVGLSDKSDTSKTATPVETPTSPSTDSQVESPPSPPAATPAAPPSLPPLDTTSLAQAPSSTSTSSSAATSAAVDDGASLATPASATWSRSRVPEGEETDEGGLTPIEEVKSEGGGEEKGEVGDEPVVLGNEEGEKKDEVEKEEAVKEKKEEEEAVQKAEDEEKPVKEEPPIEAATSSPVPAPARPAFVLTRPTLSGENETVSITQPSTPSTSVKGDNDEKEEIEEKKHDKKDSTSASSVPEPKKRDSQSIKLDTAFLTETKVSGAFFASPVPVSAITPSRTAAFFGTDFQVQLPSPPRPGGAFITELASDVESIAEKVVQAVLPSSAKKDDRAGREDERSTSRSKGGSHPSRSPYGRDHGNERGSHSRNLKSPRPSRSRSRSPGHRHDNHHGHFQHKYHFARNADRYGVQSSNESSAVSDEEEVYHQRLPFVHSRTIVSARIVKLPSSSRREPPPSSRCEQDLQQQQQERDRPSYPRPDYSARPVPPSSAAHASNKEHRPLDVLLREFKLALEKEPTAYYAIKGVLAEFEEKQRERKRRDVERQEEQQRRRTREQQQAPFYRQSNNEPSYAPSRPLETKSKQPEPSRRQDKPRKASAPPPVPRPVHRYSLTQTSDEGSDTEIEAVRKPAPRPSYQYKPLQVPRLDRDYDLGHGLVLPSAPAPPPVVAAEITSMIQRQVDALSRPEYPPHLSPRKQHVGHGKAKGRDEAKEEKDYPLVRKTSGGPPPPAPRVVKPVPLRPGHHDGQQLPRVYRKADLDNRDRDRKKELKREEKEAKKQEKRFPSPARGQTLTVAQAARLAEGLGRESEAERLRNSGLRGKDKVSKMEKEVSGGGGKGAKGEKREKEKVTEKKEKMPLRRRHSFDSVVDFVPLKKKEEDNKNSTDAAADERKQVRYGDLKKPLDRERDLPFRLKSFHLPSASLDRFDPPNLPLLSRPGGPSIPPTPDTAALEYAIALAGLRPVAGGKKGSKDKDKDGGVYPSPTVENGKRPHFYFGGGEVAPSPAGRSAVGKDVKDVKGKGKERAKGKVEEGEVGRKKRGREQSVPQVMGPGSSKRQERYGGARGPVAAFDFDDFM